MRPDNTAYDGRVRDPDARPGPRPGAEQARWSASTPRPSTRPTSTRSGSRSRSRWSRRLQAHDLDDADDEVIIQSFEVANLRELDGMIDVDSPSWSTQRGAVRPRRPAPGPTPRPGDAGGPAAGSRRTPTASAPTRTWCCRATRPAPPAMPSALVGDAHAAGLVVHVWTLRRENQFMATNFRSAPTRTRRVTCSPSRWRSSMPGSTDLLRQPRHRGAGRWPTGSASARASRSSSTASGSAHSGSGSASAGVAAYSGFDRRPVSATASSPASTGSEPGEGQEPAQVVVADGVRSRRGARCGEAEERDAHHEVADADRVAGRTWSRSRPRPGCVGVGVWGSVLMADLTARGR